MIRLMVFIFETFNDPKGVILLLTARRILRGRSLIEAAALSIVLTALLAGILELLMLQPGDQPPTSVLAWLLTGFTSLAVSTVLTHVIARGFKGKASFADTLVANVWLQLILSFLQAASILAYLVYPGLYFVVLAITVAVTFYLYSNFVAEINGFASAVSTFLYMILIIIGIAIILTSLTISVGVQSGGI